MTAVHASQSFSISLSAIFVIVVVVLFFHTTVRPLPPTMQQVVPQYVQSRWRDDHVRAAPGWQPARWCRATLSFYAEFDGMLSRLVASLAANNVTVEAWAEMRLLAELSTHACRTLPPLDHSIGGAKGLGARSATHFRLVPVPWASIAALPTSQRFLFSREATALMAQLRDQRSFRLDAEHQVVFDGGSAAPMRDSRLVIVRMLPAGSQGMGCRQHDGEGDECRPRTISLPQAGRGAVVANIFWQQLRRLVPTLPRAGTIVPMNLCTAARQHGQLILGVCSLKTANSLYAGGQKRTASAVQCSRWHRSVRAVYDGPVALCMGDAASAELSDAINGGDAGGPARTWLLDNLEKLLPRHPPVTSSTFKSFRGNQLRILWYAHILAELEVVAPAARVLALDTRDIVVQAPPFAAILASTPSSCKLVLVGDCMCVAAKDSYFKRWTHCLPPTSIAAISDGSPPNGGVTSGLVGWLRLLYERAATLAVSAAVDCRAGGREQIVLTAAAYELKALAHAEVCLIPNDPKQQTVAFNMGVNNRLHGFELNSRSGFAESAALRRPIAIIHQFDRRPAVEAFLMAHLQNRSAAPPQALTR